jgi:type I restriction enzyme S subunit
VSKLPEQWEQIYLGELVALKTGPFGSTLHKSDYTTGGIPVVNPMHIIGGKIVPSSAAMISPETAERLSEFRLQRGDVVLGRRGEMGRCAVVGEAEHDWLCGTGSLIIRPSFAEIPFKPRSCFTARRCLRWLDHGQSESKDPT